MEKVDILEMIVDFVKWFYFIILKEGIYKMFFYFWENFFNFLIIVYFYFILEGENCEGVVDSV